MGCKVFGRREGVPYFINASAGIEDAVFCMIDSTATAERGVKVATAGASVSDGLVGVVQTGVWHGHLGTGTDKYPQNADINVVSNGQVRVKILQTTSTETDYLADGNLITVGTGGKAAKYVAPTGTITDPTMTANFGTTNVGAIITAATATLTADHPTAAEIKAWAEEVIEATLAAEATLTKAYIKEWVGDYVAAYNTGVDVARGKIVGRCVGAPVDGLVCVELIGLGGIQQG